MTKTEPENQHNRTGIWNSSVLFLSTISLVALSACTPAKNVSGEKTYIVGGPSYIGMNDIGNMDVIMPRDFSLRELGAALSDGEVRIYDLDKDFQKEPQLSPKKPQQPLLKFPLNQNYTPMDKSVTFYALTDPVEELDVIELKPLPNPVPLNSLSDNADK